MSGKINIKLMQKATRFLTLFLLFFYLIQGAFSFGFKPVLGKIKGQNKLSSPKRIIEEVSQELISEITFCTKPTVQKLLSLLEDSKEVVVFEEEGSEELLLGDYLEEGIVYTLYRTNGVCDSGALKVRIKLSPMEVPQLFDLAQPSCSNSNGVIVFKEQEGVEYSIEEGVYQVSPRFENVLPGNYELKIRAINGLCEVIGQKVSINPIRLGLLKAEALSVIQPSCSNSRGVIVFKEQDEVEYSITEGVYQATPRFENVPSGVYKLRVRSLLNKNCISELHGFVNIDFFVCDDKVTTELNTPIDIPIYQNDQGIPIEGTLTTTKAENGTIIIEDNGTPTDPSDDRVVYTPNKDFKGVDFFNYTVCDNLSPRNCKIAKVIIEIKGEGCVEVHNHISPNGDGLNDYLKITCIENFPDNDLEIFNRLGNTVFKAHGYNNEENTFRGVSKGRLTIKTAEKLPTGTYFYILNLGKDEKLRKGYIYIK